eukprot:scaffold1541_cov418-Prasinococcus_capsulatus_cf.AAC.19
MTSHSPDSIQQDAARCGHVTETRHILRRGNQHLNLCHGVTVRDSRLQGRPSTFFTPACNSECQVALVPLGQQLLHYLNPGGAARSEHDQVMLARAPTRRHGVAKCATAQNGGCSEPLCGLYAGQDPGYSTGALRDHAGARHNHHCAPAQSLAQRRRMASAPMWSRQRGAER